MQTTQQNSADLRPLTLDDLRARPTVTVEEAGAMLGLSRSSTYAAARRGQIQTIRIGRRLVVPSSSLLRMLDPQQPAESA